MAYRVYQNNPVEWLMDFLLKCKRDKEFIELPRVVLLFLETLYPLISAPFSIMFAKVDASRRQNNTLTV